MTARFVLHHNPQSRSARVRWLLEETGAPYDIVEVDLRAGGHKRPEFLALNPDGKIPLLVDRGPDCASETIVTEAAAIVIHVADAVPEAGLAPAPGSVERGPYLQWIVYAVSALEPALVDHLFPRAEPAPASLVGWPPFERGLARVHAAIPPGGWLVGGRFTAADVAVGSLLGWLRSWDKLPDPQRFDDYLARIAERPAHARSFGR